MSSRSEIANMALSHIGQGNDITDVDSDSSAEAKACRRFLDIAIDNVLRDFDWNFARVYASFNLVATNPTPEWGFAYRLPADCLNFKRIITGFRQTNHDNAMPFRLGTDVTGGLVYTDMPNMQGAYTSRVTNTALFPPDMVIALSYLLASLILTRISSGDPYNIRKLLMQAYQMAIGNARANGANEEQLDKPSESEFIRARNDGTGISPYDRPREV